MSEWGDVVEEALLGNLAGLATAGSDRTLPRPRQTGRSLAGDAGLALFDDQATSRHLDLAARWLRVEGAWLLHDRLVGPRGQRRGGQRAPADRPGPAPLPQRRVLRRQSPPGGRPRSGRRRAARGMLAASDEPMAGGRHKVFGHPDLAIIPQTSTIASHLPRALGVAFAIGRARKLEAPICWPADALVVCSFGDASANHSTATGAVNTAVRVALPAPAPAAAPGLRGQRHRHLGPHAGRAGSRRPMDIVPTSATSRSTAPTPLRSWPSRLGWPSGSGSSSARPSSTWRPCASAGTPAPTWRRRTGRPRRCVGTTVATRCSARLASLVAPAWRRRRSWSSATSESVRRCGRGPRSCWTGPP